MALTISTSISVKPDRRAAHGLGASKGSDGAASIAVVDNNGPMTLRLRQAKRHALARTRATRRGGAQERAPAAQPRDSGFRGCRGLAGRNGTFQSMMPLIVASRGSDWKEDGAGRLSPFLLYGGVSRRQPRYPMLTLRAGSFASLPCDSFADCCFSSLCVATRHDS